jgi:hypothetical protein
MALSSGGVAAAIAAAGVPSGSVVLECPYRFYGAVRDAIVAKDPEVVLSGPADTGKTLGLLYKLHRLALKYPGCQLSIVRKVREDLVGTVLQTWKRDIMPYAPFVQPYGGEKPEWYDYPNGSRIWLGGLDKPGKTLSSERDVIYVNQCEQITNSDWEYLTRCVTGRGAVMPYTQLIGCCNPSHPSHWILRRKQSGKLRFLVTTHRDNPTIYNRDGTVKNPERLERLARLSGSLRLRLFVGIWAPPEGAVYSMFDPTKHVIPAFPIPRTWPRFVGIDPVGAQVAAVWVAFDPQNQVLNVYREYLEPFGVTTPKHAENVLAKSGYGVGAIGEPEPIFAWIGGSTSERQSRTDWSAVGVPLLEPPYNDLEAGLDKVASLLSEMKMVIHDNLPNLISEFGDYRRKFRSGQPSDYIVEKEMYHLLDALRYVVAWLTGPIIERRVMMSGVTIAPDA